MHPSCTGVREFPEFEINDDETSEPSVEEDQVDPVRLVCDAQSMLESDESEITPKFQ